MKPTTSKSTLSSRSDNLMQLASRACLGFKFAGCAFRAFVLTVLPGHAKLS
jgi:hypothetical protein